MAGAGYKLFNTGDVLTAAQVNTYLQEQAVMRFANAAARTTALASVLAEGMVSYLQDTDAVEVYNGTAWVGIGNSGDITGVTAGTGISGGGTSGTVTITNDMATTITAAGDIVVGTGSGTYDNLPIGTTGQVLTADTTVSPYKVKWATASGGGKVLQVVQDTATSNFTTTSATFVDTGLSVSITPSLATSKVLIIANMPFAWAASANKGDFACAWNLVRDTTQLCEGNLGVYGIASSTAPSAYGSYTLMTLDSPSTTSALTYKVQGKKGDGDSANYQGSATRINSIVVMEIGA